ncbi:MAG: alpha/beta hydrolase family protein [Actinomycetota bacterium]
MNAPRTIARLLILVTATASVALPATGAHASARSCTDGSAAVIHTQRLLGLSGLYAKPAGVPKQLVVFDHGYGKSATAYWAGHLREAADHGALAVAVDYRGIGPAPDYRGWNVSAGAADSIKAAKTFLRICPSLKQVFLLGVSMGGNASGLAVASGAKRTDGTPLFDYWVDIEGATNVTETYNEASAVAPSGNAYATRAKEDIENEMGGTFEEVPDRYLEESVVTRGADIAASGVKGVILVHGLGDGLVPYDQSRELESALVANDVPTDFFTVGTRGEGEPGTTLDGYVPVDHVSPFAGHGGEESTTQLVITTGFDQLWSLMAGTTAIGPHREFFVDGDTGLFLPPQAA